MEFLLEQYKLCIIWIVLFFLIGKTYFLLKKATLRFVRREEDTARKMVKRRAGVIDWLSCDEFYYHGYIQESPESQAPHESGNWRDKCCYSEFG